MVDMNERFTTAIVAIFALSLLGVGCVGAVREKTRPYDVPANAPLLGGDRDEHGCIGSAGYSWCEPKAKCLRVWEESCGSAAAEGVRQALAKKYDKPISEVTVNVTAERDGFARGGVKFGPAEGEGGMFLAKETGGFWTLAYDGNGSVDCKAMKGDFGFPADMLAGFCD